MIIKVNRAWWGGEKQKIQQPLVIRGNVKSNLITHDVSNEIEWSINSTFSPLQTTRRLDIEKRMRCFFLFVYMFFSKFCGFMAFRTFRKEFQLTSFYFSPDFYTFEALMISELLRLKVFARELKFFIFSKKKLIWIFHWWIK